MNNQTKNIVMLGDSRSQSGGIATVQNLIIKYASPQLNIEQIPTRDEGSAIYKLYMFARSIWLLVWRLLTKPTDLVHIHIADGGSILRKAIIVTIALAFQKPVLMHAHGAVFHLNYAKLPKSIQQILHAIFSRCRGWIALTSFWQDFYITSLGLNPDRVFILLNPTELPPKVPLRIGSTKIAIAFVGRICQRKGTFDLIRAFANLPEHLQNSVELAIAGNGEIEQARQLAESLNLTDRINFLGLIDAQQRDRLLEQTDIYILPTYNEGLPLALLEAMSWGLPVITTPVSGIPDVVNDHHNGLLVTPGDLHQLTEAMSLLIENEDLRICLGKSARATVSALDVSFFSKRLTEIYQLVLAP